MYKTFRISDFLHQIKYPVKLDSDKEYSLVTVRLHHKGVTLREKKKGSLLGSKMFRISEGQFVLSGIDARNGAFGIVPKELDGAIVTNDFWYFNVDEKIVKREFFYWLTNTPLFLDACIKSSKGETQRIRLQKDLFFNFELKLPSVEHQETFLSRIASTDLNLKEFNDELNHQSQFCSKLRQQILQEAIEGKLTAKWRQQHPDLISGDNHASKLLEKIKSKKANLIKDWKLKKEKPLSPITEDEKPFELPEGWVWCRLGEVVAFDTGKLDSNAAVAGGIYPFFTCSKDPLAIDNFGFDCEAVLLAGNNAAGKYNVKYYNGRFNAYQRTYVITAYQNLGLALNYHYLHNLLEYSLDYLREKSLGSLTQYLTLGIIKPLIIPFPSIAEQNAIVDRINKLMSTIGELEKQVSERKELSEKLMQAVLREAFEEDR